MLNWNENPNRHTATDVEDLAYPPSGGRVKLVLLGIILPLAIIHFGIQAWTSEKATWFGNQGSSVVVHGATARSLAITQISVGLFCHFRWFWGLIPVYRAFEIGIIISILGFLGGLFSALYFAFT
jgi:hypothetical protein